MKDRPKEETLLRGLRLKEILISWSAAIRASRPAAAARPVEAGLGPARDGWPLGIYTLFFRLYILFRSDFQRFSAGI